QPSAGEDQRHDRDAGTLGLAQHTEQRLLACAGAAIQQMLAPSEMPLLHGEGQCVGGDPIETLVGGCERTNALEIVNDLERHLLRRSRELLCSKRAAHRTRPQVSGSNCIGLSQWTVPPRADPELSMAAM